MSDTTATPNYDWRFPALGVGLCCCGLLAISAVALIGNTKLTAVASATLLLGILSYLSGNPRLVCLWCLMLTIPLNLSKYFGTILDKGGAEVAYRIEVSDPFILALLACQAWEIWAGHRRGIRVPRASFFWMLVMVMGSWAVVVGPWRSDAMLELVRMLKVLVLFLVVVNELETPRWILHCVSALTLSVLAQSIIGIAQYLLSGTLGLEKLGETSADTIETLAETTLQTGKVWRVSALLLHPNIFGIFLAVLLPIVLAVLLVKVRFARGFKLFAGVTAAIGMAALIATESRSSWVSFAAAFAVVMVLTFFHQILRHRSLIAAIGLTAILSLTCLIFWNQITTRLFESKDEATNGREEFKIDAKNIINDYFFFGCGLAGYVDVLPQYLRYSREAYGPRGWLPPVHHIYYLWWAETGIVGLMIHLSMLGAILGAAIGNFRVKNEVLYAINAGCLGGILAFMVDGFLSFSLRVNPTLRVFFVVAGIIMAIRYLRLRQSVPGDRPSQVVAPAANFRNPPLEDGSLA